MDLDGLQKRLGERIVRTGMHRGLRCVVTPTVKWLLKPLRHKSQALWWAAVDQTIRRNGFRSMPGFFVWKDWLVMRFLCGRTIRYQNVEQLREAVKLLARFHKAAHGIRTPSGRTANQLPEKLTRRYKQYEEMYSALSAFPEFSLVAEEYRMVGEQALHRLTHSALKRLTKADAAAGCVAHRDLASHNILMNNENELWLIDFETADIDLQLGDLWQLASRALAVWRWDPAIYGLILRAYEEIRPLSADERMTLGQLFLFPNDFYRESLGLLRRREGFVAHRVIPYLRMLIRDREYWRLFLQAIGAVW